MRPRCSLQFHSVCQFRRLDWIRGILQHSVLRFREWNIIDDGVLLTGLMDSPWRNQVGSTRPYFADSDATLSNQSVSASKHWIILLPCLSTVSFSVIGRTGSTKMECVRHKPR